MAQHLRSFQRCGAKHVRLPLPRGHRNLHLRVLGHHAAHHAASERVLERGGQLFVVVLIELVRVDRREDDERVLGELPDPPDRGARVARTGCVLAGFDLDGNSLMVQVSSRTKR